MRQEAVINNPGAALAPGIRTLTRTSPTADPITTNVAAVTFQATTTAVPEKVRWSLDNVLQGDATGSNFTWNFTWNISAVDDGTYLVGARAFNKFGDSGTTRTLTVVLNRFAPRAPTGFVAGRNGSIGVEFEWNPNTERDVSGYRVYRVAGAAPSAADTLVCTTQTTDRLPTSCRDTDALAADATLYYYVVAVAPARPPATDVEESPRPTLLSQTYQVSNSNLPPNPPTDLRRRRRVTARSRSPGAIRSLRLPARPATPSATTGSIATASSYGDRYDRTGSGIEHVFVDTDPGPGTHSYSVTTVDSQLAESAPVTIAGVGP